MCLIVADTMIATKNYGLHETTRSTARFFLKNLKSNFHSVRVYMISIKYNIRDNNKIFIKTGICGLCYRFTDLLLKSDSHI